MRVLYFIATSVICGLLLLMGIRSWPYIQDKIRGRALDRKFEAAKQESERIGSQLRGDHRFGDLKLYAWPMEGVVIVFEGSVRNSNDLVELKRLVDTEKVSTPVRWRLTVSTNAPGERERSEPADN